MEKRSGMWHRLYHDIYIYIYIRIHSLIHLCTLNSMNTISKDQKYSIFYSFLGSNVSIYYYIALYSILTSPYYYRKFYHSNQNQIPREQHPSIVVNSIYNIQNIEQPSNCSAHQPYINTASISTHFEGFAYRISQRAVQLYECVLSVYLRERGVLSRVLDFLPFYLQI